MCCFGLHNQYQMCLLVINPAASTTWTQLIPSQYVPRRTVCVQPWHWTGWSLRSRGRRWQTPPGVPTQHWLSCSRCRVLTGRAGCPLQRETEKGKVKGKYILAQFSATKQIMMISEEKYSSFYFIRKKDELHICKSMISTTLYEFGSENRYILFQNIATNKLLLNCN